MCTRIFNNRFNHFRVVGRTFDWEVSDEGKLWYYPTGLVRSGQCENEATWSVRFRNLAMSMWGLGSTDGINEAGLAAHLLYLAASDFGARDERPGISMALWAQYVLDRFGTVAEVIDHLDDIQIVQIPLRGQTIGAHLALEDQSGDSAIIEFIDGAPRIHHGREHRVMANDPAYDEQLASLTRYAAFGGTEEIPGNIYSPQRFARATYFLDFLTQPTTDLEAVAGVMSIARNTSVPFGAPYDDFGVYPTWWASVCDLTTRTYYFQSTLAPNVVWASLEDEALLGCPDALCIDPSEPTLTGGVASQMIMSDPTF